MHTYRIVHLKFQCASGSLGVMFEKTALSILVPDSPRFLYEAWALSSGVVVLFAFQNYVCMCMVYAHVSVSVCACAHVEARGDHGVLTHCS